MLIIHKCNVLLCGKVKESSDRDKFKKKKKKKARYYQAASATAGLGGHGGCPVPCPVGIVSDLHPHCTPGGFAVAAFLNA